MHARMHAYRYVHTPPAPRRELRSYLVPYILARFVGMSQDRAPGTAGQETDIDRRSMSEAATQPALDRKATCPTPPSRDAAGARKCSVPRFRKLHDSSTGRQQHHT